MLLTVGLLALLAGVTEARLLGRKAGAKTATLPFKKTPLTKAGREAGVLQVRPTGLGALRRSAELG